MELSIHRRCKYVERLPLDSCNRGGRGLDAPRALGGSAWQRRCWAPFRREDQDRVSSIRVERKYRGGGDGPDIDYPRIAIETPGARVRTGRTTTIRASVRPRPCRLEPSDRSSGRDRSAATPVAASADIGSQIVPRAA
jgi:hypothetical protein